MIDRASSDASGSDRARDPRTNMFIAASIEWAGSVFSVTVRNLSRNGALVEAADLPPAGSVVRLVRGALTAQGSVQWHDGRRAGLLLEGQVFPALWMAKPSVRTQADVDRMVRAIRSGEPVTPDQVAMPTAGIDEVSPLTLPTIEAEIRHLEALLAEVSDDLANDPETIIRHGAQLQKLDLLAQGLARLRQ